MAAPIIQPAFASGELAPQLQARVDLAQFHTGCARALNLYVDYRGGLTSRPGTRLVTASRTQEPEKHVRLIKFQFSILQTYVLEFGDLYMRVIKNGGIIAPGGVPYVIPTPWAHTDVGMLKFAQSNDVMTITHPNYPPYDLARFAETDWRISRVSFAPTVQAPTITAITSSQSFPAGSAVYYTDFIYDYVVTAIGADGAESQASQRNYIRTYSFDDVKQSISVNISVVPGATRYNVYKARLYVAPRNAAGAFPPYAAVYGYVGSTEGQVFSDNNVVPDFSRAPPKHRDPFATRPIVSVGVLTGGAGYGGRARIVTNDVGGTGSGEKLIPVIDDSGSVVAVRVFDGGRDWIAPNVVVANGPGEAGSGAQLPATLGPATGTYPGVVTYFQQRKIYAATLNQPATYWATKSGQFNNMDVSVPPRDDDSVTFTLAALEQNPIKYMIPMQNGLVMLTGGAAWLVSGGDNKSALTPTAVSQTPQVYNGCADVLPLVIGYNIIYVQEKGYVVQDIKFDFFSNVYTGEDRTYLSSHLFEGRSVVEWCWAEQPHKLIWAVMSDGQLISMTYIPEQKVYGWTQHLTFGFVESIVSCPEGDYDAVYICVRRPTGRYIERLERRQGWKTTKDAWALDSALRYQGPAVTQVSGLEHLAGQSIHAVGDGKYLGNLLVTVGGQLTLPVACSDVLVGYAFATEFQSMYLDTQMSPTPQGRRKFLPAATIRLVGSKGLRAGRAVSRLVAVKDSDPQGINLLTEDQRISLETGWESNGQVCVQGSFGLPWSMTALLPEVQMGDAGG